MSASISPTKITIQGRKESKRRLKGESKGIPRSIVEDKLTTAVISILNTAAKTERKLLASTSSSAVDSANALLIDYKFDDKAVAMGRALLGTETYTFRLVRNGTISSSAGGLFTVTISTNLNQYLEGSALIALFDECRMKSTHFEHACFDPSGSTRFSFIIGFRTVDDGVALGVNDLARLPNSKVYHTFDTTGKAHITRGTNLRNRDFGLCDQESATTPLISQGCRGEWGVAVLGGTVSASTLYLSYRIVSTAQFRART